MNRKVRALFLVVVVLFLAASAFAAGKEGDAITVTGKLVKGGVECQRLLQDKTGVYFTLTPRPAKKFKNGQHVRVTGTTAGVSPCQQDTTIAVKSIKRI